MKLTFWIFLALLGFVYAGSDDYYAILGVKKDASKDDIRRAYKRLSIKYHPDKNKGDGAEEAQKKFIQVSHAYEVLSDDKKKDIYDRFGADGLKQHEQGGAGGFHDPFDIFAQFTRGFGGRGHSQEEKRGPTISMVLDVTLEDIYLGKVIEVEIDRQNLCSKCGGSGAKSSSDVKTCHVCGGRGVRISHQQIAPGFVQQVQTACNECGGKGKIIKSQCPHCKGKKVHRHQEILDVVIDRGMPDGEVITFDEAGDQSPEYAPGDVKFTIKTKPHAVFTRRGANLYIKEFLSLYEALTGFERTIKHLDGSSVKLKRSYMTPSGYVQTVSGKGMPIYKTGGYGNLFVEYGVVFPSGKVFTDEEKNTIKSLFAVPATSSRASTEETHAEL